jgi:hypothetical protein
MSRPRHPDKDLERVLRAAERQGWRVVKPGRYFKMYCPCPGEHMQTVHITPNRKYRQNLMGQLRRATCWKDE